MTMTALALVGCAAWLGKDLGWQPWNADFATVTGERRGFQLPDGTRLELNTHNAANLDFSARQRLITLARGEIMDQRLAALPVRSPRWRYSYPELATMSRERAPIPEGNDIHDNRAAESGAPKVVEIARETGRIELPAPLRPPSQVNSAKELLDLCRDRSACQAPAGGS